MLLALAVFGLAAFAAGHTGDKCTDKDELCSFWATEFDQCTQNAVWMKPNCPASCGECEGEKKVIVKSCEDKDPNCAAFEKQGECDKNPFYMFWKCTKACRFCDKSGPTSYPQAFVRQVKKQGVKEGTTSTTEGGNCVDQNDLCPYWASLGECNANPSYMQANCKASCTSCTGKKIKVEKCANEDANCDTWKSAGECTKPSPYYMFWKCEKACGFCTNDNEMLDYPTFFNAQSGSTNNTVQHSPFMPSVAGSAGTSPQPPTSQPPTGFTGAAETSASFGGSAQTSAPVAGSAQTSAPVAGSAQTSAPLEGSAQTSAPVSVPTQPVPTGSPSETSTGSTTPVIAQAGNAQPSSAVLPEATQAISETPSTTPAQAQGGITGSSSAVTDVTGSTTVPVAQTQSSVGVSITGGAPAGETTSASVSENPIPSFSAGVTVPAVSTVGFAQANEGNAQTQTVAQPIASTGDCTDKHVLCAFWHSIGECTANPTYMQPNCPASCTATCASTKKIRRDNCADVDTNCAAFGKQGECSKEHIFYMFWKCPQTCGWCTGATGADTDYPAALFTNGPMATHAPTLIRIL